MLDNEKWKYKESKSEREIELKLKLEVPGVKLSKEAFRTDVIKCDF